MAVSTGCISAQCPDAVHMQVHPCLYLNGLQGATEEHVVGGHECAHRVVVGPDGVHFLQVLDIPYLQG